METANISHFLIALARLSIQAGVLVGLVLAVQWVFRKQLNPRWRCALWLLVVARLLLPLSVASVTSVFNLVPHWNEPVLSSPILSEPVFPAAPISLNYPASGPTPDFSGEKPVLTPMPAPARVTTSAPVSSPPVIFHHAWSWPVCLFVVWLSGVILLTAHIAIGSVRLWRRCAKMRPLTDSAALAILDECRARLDLRAKLALVEGGEVTNPALFGFLRPRLLLPVGFTEKFSPLELRFVFLHELAHLKRRDLLVNWILVVPQVMHWFNPLVWFGFARWRADRELACDAMALEAAGGDQNHEYGQTILRLLENFTHPMSAPGLVGILEDKRQLRRRIRMIAGYVPTCGWPRLALVLIVLLAVIGLTDAQNRAPVLDEGKTNAAPAAVIKTSPAASSPTIPRPVITNGAVVKVIVLNAETGAPLPNAEVLIQNGAPLHGGSENAPRWKTGVNGETVIHLGAVPEEHLQRRNYLTLSVRAEGFSPRGKCWVADNDDARPNIPPEVTVRLTRGVTAGGFVRDENGTPVPGAVVRIYGSDEPRREPDWYSEFWNDSAGAPALTTDASGRWQVRDFPHDLRAARIEFTRRDGSTRRFIQRGETDQREFGQPFNLFDLKANNAVFVLTRGGDIRGIVVDPEGRPLPDVLLRVGYGTFTGVNLPDIRADSAGRFELRDCDRRQIIFTAYPEHYAITSVVVDVGANESSTLLRVAPLAPLRIHVLDGDGRALTGVRVTPYPVHTGGQLLDFASSSDSGGMLVWTNAPESEFTLRAALPGGDTVQDIRVTPKEREVTFRLRRGMGQEIVINGRVHDAKTGKPVKLDWISYQTADRGGFGSKGLILESGFQIRIPAAQFRTGGIYPSFQLKLEAWRYGTLITEWRDFFEGDWNPDLALQPEVVSHRAVLLPNGKPAAGARVTFPSISGWGPMYYTSPDAVVGDQNFGVETDAGGGFELPSLPEDQPVIITHGEGFLKVTRAELEPNRVIRLQPWASVTGVLRVDGKPLGNEVVNLKSPMSGYGVDGYILTLDSRTDPAGKFIFSNLPPGDFVLSRLPRGLTYGWGVDSHRLPFDLKAGETKHMDYGFGGHKIIGRVETGVPVDWGNDLQELALKVSPAPATPVTTAYAGDKEFRKAYENYWRSPELLDYNRKQQHFPLVFDAGGNFQTDDVPPGVYELRLRVTKPLAKSVSRIQARYSGREEVLGSLVREIRVPAGTEALDLGTFKMELKPSARDGASLPGEPGPKTASVAPSNASPAQAAVVIPSQAIATPPALKVMILDEKTGEPISGAEVSTDALRDVHGFLKNTPRRLTDRTGVVETPRGEPPGEGATRWCTITARHKSYSPRSAFWVEKWSDARTNPPAEVTIRLSTGVTAGGTVRDERGVPLAGIQVKISGSDNPLRFRNLLPGETMNAAIQRIEDGKDRQFASFEVDPAEAAGLKTDAAGHWRANHFPADLHFVDITLTRPDGTYKNFIQRGGVFQREGPGSVDLDDLKANRAVLVLEVGIDVRGVVLRERRPVPMALVRLYNGETKPIPFSNLTRTGGVQTDDAGRFVLRHCVPGLTKFSAESNNFSAGQTEVDVEADMPEAHLHVGPRQLPTIGLLAVP